MKHTGGCHCGAVRYEVEMMIDKLLECNCSICSKRGQLLAFAPDSSFKLLKGEESLADYQFGKKHLHHMFCKICGIPVFGWGKGQDGTKMRAINARCVDDIDIKSIPVFEHDGKSM